MTSSVMVRTFQMFINVSKNCSNVSELVRIRRWQWNWNPRFQISENGVEISNRIKSAIINFQSPKTVKQIRRLIGLPNFCRSQIHAAGGQLGFYILKKCNQSEHRIYTMTRALLGVVYTCEVLDIFFWVVILTCMLTMQLSCILRPEKILMEKLSRLMTFLGEDYFDIHHCKWGENCRHTHKGRKLWGTDDIEHIGIIFEDTKIAEKQRKNYISKKIIRTLTDGKGGKTLRKAEYCISIKGVLYRIPPKNDVRKRVKELCVLKHWEENGWDFSIALKQQVIWD